MLVNEKYLSYFDNNDINILTVKNNTKNVINRIPLISSVSNNISNKLEQSK